MSAGRANTNTIKAALKAVFPGVKFIVTHGGKYIRWTDGGPPEDEVKAIIAKLPFVETNEAWNGETYLRLDRYGNNIAFDRYNAAEVAQRERRAEAALAQDAREHEELAAARRERDTALPRPSMRVNSIKSDEATTAAFNTLRQRAEAIVATDQERTRRPSWAPGLILDGELLDLCRSFDLLAPDDAPVGRLWASFADPTARVQALRSTRSSLELPGIQCRGFDFHAGSERGNAEGKLFTAHLDRDGAWTIGPSYWPSLACDAEYDPAWGKLFKHRQTIMRLRGTPEYSDERIAEIDRQIAEIDAAVKTRASMRCERVARRVRALELARARSRLRRRA